MLKKTENLVMIIVGIIFDALGVAAFTLPYDILCGGVTGLGRVVEHFMGMQVSHVVGVINVVLFLLALFTLGKKFAATILLGSFLYPVFLDVFIKWDALQHLVEDPLLAAICGGCLIGAGLGLIIRGGGASGGSDVPVIILNRKFGWPLSPMLYAVDGVILLMQIPFADTNEVIMAILQVLVYTIVMNKVIIMGQSKVQIMVFSKKVEEINQALLTLNLGTTLLHGKTGYFAEERDVVVCIFSNKYMNRVRECILDIDPTAFMSVISVSEVSGRGFTLPQKIN